MATANCLALLKKQGVTDVTTHSAVMNVAEMLADGALAKLAGSHNITKNLLLKDKKKNLILVCAHHESKINLKDASVLGGKGNCRFAGEKDLSATLAIPQGHVSPLACLNDKEHKVSVVLDKTLDDGKKMLVHPCTNEQSVHISFGDLQKYLQDLGAEVLVVDFSGEGGADTAAAAPAKKAEKQKPKKDKPKKEKKEQKKQQPKKAKGGKGKGGKGNNEDGIDASKKDNFASWYKQVVLKSEMIEYYDISGCYILRPWSYEIWETIQGFFDPEIKKLNVKNSYFPLFVSKGALEAEADHIEDFAPEVAWVTRSGKSELDQPIAVRPTSETIMYPAFKKWIRSHRDLPMKLHQWSNVVRWEFKCPTPFIRSREFLWQEGHTAYADLPSAEEEVLDILDLYARIYEELLCVPVVKGKKTEKEKFAGGMYTTTVEAFVPATGRGIQGATSHCLGQNFSEMFKIEFLDESGNKKKVWQNSWGCTTRTIGVMVMVHGDDKGLVLPPRVAPLQSVIIPIFFGNADEKAALAEQASKLVQSIKAAGMRCEADLRENYNPGWKFNNWELKGVPFQIQLGPKDMKAEQVVVVRRDTSEKTVVKWADLTSTLAHMCVRMQSEMLERARKEHAECMVEAKDWKTFMGALDQRKFCLSPWCGFKACEESIKERTAAAAEEEEEEEEKEVDPDQPQDAEKLSGAAKSLCTPLAQPPLPENMKCFACTEKAQMWTMYGRSY